MREPFLCTEARKGNVLTVRALLEQGYTTTAKDAYGNTPLHWAAYAGSAPVIRTLLEHGAYCNAVNRRGFTPLHLAVRQGNAAVVKELLENPYAFELDLDIPTDAGMTPIHFVPDEHVAAHLFSRERKRHVPCERQVIAEMRLSNLVDRRERTALHWAALRGHVGGVQSLLEGGADWALKDQDGMTARALAMRSRHARVASIIDSYAAGYQRLCERCGLYVIASDLQRHQASVRCRNYKVTFSVDRFTWFPTVYRRLAMLLYGHLRRRCLNGELLVPQQVAMHEVREIMDFVVSLIKGDLEESKDLMRRGGPRLERDDDAASESTESGGAGARSGATVVGSMASNRDIKHVLRSTSRFKFQDANPAVFEIMAEQFHESLYMPPRSALSSIRYVSEQILSFL